MSQTKLVEPLEGRILFATGIGTPSQPGMWGDYDHPSATLAAPAKDGIVNVATLNKHRYLDVVVWDTGRSGLNPATITDAAPEFTLAGAAAANVVVNGAGVLQPRGFIPADGTAPVKGSSVFRYSFTGDFTAGAVTLTFTANTYADNAGNGNVSSPKQFYVTSKQIVGYLPDYESAQFNNIDYSAITHVNFFSISSDTTGKINTPSTTFMNRLKTVVTEAHYNGDTVSICIVDSAPSPWSTGAVSFPAVAASATARANFANQLITFCQQNKLDGVDLDWEPVKNADVANYGVLISDLRAALAPQGLMLSAAAHASHKDFPASAANNLDWVGVMTYDIKATDHSTYNDTLTYLNGWVSYGVPKSKILMGVPFYARDAAFASKTYRALVEEFHPAPNLDQVGGWGYSGIDTMKRKLNYVYDNGYAGMMIWELGQDHFDSAGKFTQYSLLPAIKSVVVSRASTSPGSLSIPGNSGPVSGLPTESARRYTGGRIANMLLSAG